MDRQLTDERLANIRLTFEILGYRPSAEDLNVAVAVDLVDAELGHDIIVSQVEHHRRDPRYRL